jgi:hypothetical protein
MIKTFMYFTILTFAVVVVWIALTIYWNFTPKNSPKSDITVVPIVGNFDFDTITRLKSRTPITADFDATFTSSQSAQTKPQPTQQSSASAILESTIPPTLESSKPIATPSGL